MKKELLPIPQETPKTLSGARSQLEDLEKSISGNSNTIDTLKNTIYTGGAKISEIGKILGVNTPFLSSKSVKDALTQVNNDFTSSFKSTAEVIGHINTNLSNTLVIMKFMIICMGQITYNQRKDKKASEKAVKRLKDITEKIKKGEISVSELIDIFAENVEAEAKEYKQLEEKLSQLQSEWQNIQKDLNDKLQTIVHEAESLEKSHDSYITDLNNKLSVTITEIKNKHEEVSSLLKNEQKESLDKIDKLVNESLTKAEERTNTLEKSQEEFISQSNEQTSQALEALAKKREDDTIAIQNELKLFLDKTEGLVNENLAKTKEKTNDLVKSQEEFISQSKEQTSLALSEFQKEAKHKTAELREQTDGFIENQNAFFKEMKMQIKFYKIVSVIAISASFLSLVCNFFV